MEHDKIIIGIDLGTTNSLVSVLQDGKPVIIPNGSGELLTPSVISVDDKGNVLVGPEARARRATHPRSTAANFKRDMGTERSIKLGLRPYRPEELSALVLGSLKQDAEAFLGHPVQEAVVTVPAYFGDLQRQATRAAARIAGLKVERIVNEPTAAALAYGLHNLEREASVVVLDLGGGTFDVTVLEIIEGVIEIQSTAGDARLGGEDFTEAMFEALLAALGQQGLDTEGLPAGSRARLFEACESAKRRLGSESTPSIAVPDLQLGNGDSRDLEHTFSQEALQAAFATLTQRLRHPIMQALRDAKRAPAEVEEVLLVGGSTRLPLLRSLAAEIFAKTPRADLPADEAVAMGAAIQAGLKAGDAALDDLVVTDVAPFTLGIESVSHFGDRMVTGLFTPVLERGTVIPASREERFSTVTNNQTQIEIKVYQGEHAKCKDNTFLGKYTVRGIPKDKAGEQHVDVRFTYDLNGVLEVDTRIVGTDISQQLVIEQNPGALTPDQIEAARKAMAKLKFHPRETLPNRTALARAEALHVELRGGARQYLAEAIMAFEAALETQEPETIGAAREQLVAVTSELGHRR